MNVHLKLDHNMRLIATNALGQETPFDANPEIGGENSSPTPMQVLLQSMVACTTMDILSILRKRRKQIDELQVDVSSTRAESHPKVFTHVTMNFRLISPDAELADLNRALELSHKNYCSASAMFQRSGCTVEWTGVVEKKG
ncbi:MAG: OsmC family protein [Candidatus Kapabacteria bacterium]|nr:OsmC family protein [Candidatus Kapabacteria bacterium]